MHPTLLPRHRGRAPIPWAILTRTRTNGRDALRDRRRDGRLRARSSGRSTLDVAPDETATTLFARIAAGARRAHARARSAASRAHGSADPAGRPPVRARGRSALPRTGSSTGRRVRRTSTTGFARRRGRTPARSRSSETRRSIVWGARPVDLVRAHAARPRARSSCRAVRGEARSVAVWRRRHSCSRRSECRSVRSVRRVGGAARMSRVLVLAAHPDDEVLGMGGTIAVHADRGDEVRVVVVTDGSSTQYPGDAEIRARKEDEALRAAAELGVTDYVHLDLPDMRLDTLPHVEVNRVVEEHVRDFAPARVYTPHPDVNRDHRVLFDSVAVATRPMPGQPVRRAAHVRAHVEHGVDAAARSTGSSRTGSSTSPRRSSGRWLRSPTTRPSDASTRIHAASAPSGRRRSSTARAAAATTPSRSCSCEASSGSNFRALARWPQLLIALALLGATAAAFAVTERLKLERSPVTGTRVDHVFSPVCECARDVAVISIVLRRRETVTAGHPRSRTGARSARSSASGASRPVASRTRGTGATTSGGSFPRASTGRVCSSSGTAARSSFPTRSASTRRRRQSARTRLPARVLTRRATDGGTA